MSFDKHTDLAITAVATAPSTPTGGTSLTVTAGTGAWFPAGSFWATVWPSGQVPDRNNAEIVRATVAGDTFTITRAQQGTSARTVAAGDLIAATIASDAIQRVEALTALSSMAYR